MTAPTTPGRPTVAVIGAGVSGLTAAYLLARTHDVTLFEAEHRLGGHAHTHDVVDSRGSTHPVDSGFIVHNDRTYPLLRRLFSELGVDVRPTEMSMSIRCEECGLEYAGGRGLRGILAQPGRLADRSFVRMLLQVRRFHRRATSFLEHTDDTDTTTYGEFLRDQGFSEHFITHYAVPVVSCVWSSGQDTALLYPARYLFRFLEHHGMLSVTGSLQWYTVVGGSRSYVDRIAGKLPAVRAGTPVSAVWRTAEGVEVEGADGVTARFDRVVVATHADQALAVLADPTEDELAVLKTFAYTPNETVLHTDPSLLPRAEQARSSWNYLMESCSVLGGAPVVTYWMNRLQGHDSAEPYLVTLNARARIASGSVIAVMDYEHPLYTAECVAAQSRLASLATTTTVFAGAYHGWGFHEDGCRSGVEAARHFGVDW